MIMKPLGILTALCCIMSCISCSVKEPREECPCRLVLDMGGVDTSVVKSAEIFVSGPDGFVHSHTHLLSEGSEYVVEVPRGVVSVGVFHGAGELVDSSGDLRIPYGDGCPPVYMHSSFVEASGEIWKEEVCMSKNHCVMTIRVLTRDDFPFRLDARGFVDGYSPGGTPSRGDFVYSMSLDEKAECSVILPRQTDASLTLEVSDGSDVLKTFSLGEYLDASGYDWEEKDLKDVVVSLDYSLTRITLQVEDWKEECVFDVVI